MVKTFSLADLPATIPVFPLPGALLLPHARLPLNIFEPRYLAMLEDTFKTDDRLIGMVQPLAHQKEGSTPALHRIGCAGRVTAMQETEDGRYLVTLAGISRFRIRDVEDGFRPYLRSSVDWSDFERDLGREPPDEGFDRPAFLRSLSKYFEKNRLSSDWDAMKEADEELLINSLAIMCPFELEEKQALLEAPTLADRREILVTLMEFAVRGGGDDGKVQ